MLTEIGIDVAAPPRRVWELARDLERWPDRLPHYVQVVVHARRAERVVARMVALRPLREHGALSRIGFPVMWRADAWPDGSDPDDLRLRFRHLRGATRGMDVTWHIRPTATGSAVTIEHDFSRSLPFLGDELLPALIDRFFTRPIAARTLARFKVLAEEAG